MARFVLGGAGGFLCPLRGSLGGRDGDRRLRCASPAATGRSPFGAGMLWRGAMGEVAVRSVRGGAGEHVRGRAGEYACGLA